MEIRDYITGGSFVVSITSLIISTYWNILRGAKYLSPPIRLVVFGLLPIKNIPIINLPITITNTGGNTGVIDSFYIDIISLSNNKKERFYAWQEGKLIEPNFQGFKQDIPTPVSLKPGESILKYYIFYPDSQQATYSKGLYKLVVYALCGSGRKPIKLSEQKLEILEVVEPSKIDGVIPIIFSFNLCYKEVLQVSTFGNFTKIS
jgi:hypothetical protein